MKQTMITRNRNDREKMICEHMFSFFFYDIMAVSI